MGHRRNRIASAVLLLCMAIGPLAGSALGSTGTAEASDKPETITLAPEPLTLARSKDNASNVFWPLAGGREAIVLDEGASGQMFHLIRRVALPSGEELASAYLGDAIRGGYASRASQGVGTMPGAAHVIAVDEPGGRLFVAYGYDASPINQAGVRPESGHLCPDPALLLSPIFVNCVGGLYVLDASTLQQKQRIDLRQIGVDAVPPKPELVAMEYVPPLAPGGGGKVLMQLAVSLVPGTEPSCGATHCNPESQHLPPQYLVQIDADRGAVEWVLRLDACRGNRSGSQLFESEAMRSLPHHSALFRSTSAERPMIVVGCRYGTALTGQIVQVPLDAAGHPAALPVAVGNDPAGALETGVQERKAPPSGAIAGPTGSPRVITGPDRVMEIVADPASERMLMRVVDGGAEVWWVYDHAVGAFIGTIGIGAVSDGDQRMTGSLTALDRTTGRLYVLARPHSPRSFLGGLFVADTRRTPVAQALHFPEFAPLVPVDAKNRLGVGVLTMVAVGGSQDAPTRLYVPRRQPPAKERSVYHVLEDRLPVSVEVEEDFGAGRTLDLDELEGVTAASADGAARGYGARLLLVGGVDGAARVGPADPVGIAYICNHPDAIPIIPGNPVHGPCSAKGVLPPDTAGMPPGHLASPCTASNRELVLGAVGVSGPVVLDAAGGRGSAEPIVTDSSLRSDTEAPASRCTGKDWGVAWSAALFGRPLVDEPALDWPATERPAECVSGDRESDRVGDGVTQVFAAQMDCQSEEVSGFSYVRGRDLGIGEVGEALSSFRVYRDPGRGIVARVESVARGVNIDGAIRIDSVRGTAESWANGRAFTPPALEDGKVYEPNCDYERTAGTCFQRHLFGVRTPGYSCGPCGDEATLIDRMGRAMGANGVVRLREPDEQLARGADNGFAAGIVKPVAERFADLALNSDLLQTTVPTLEFIRYAPPNRPYVGGGARGRQVIQLAGVEVSTSYAIQCLLIYDAATNTCAAETQQPGSIQVSLGDADGKPLAGGAFEVRQDSDADGLLGLKDALLPNGACVTADDGIGTCTFDNIQPGSYLVGQVAAPPGFAKTAEPFAVELGSGEQRTIAFTNVSNMSTVQLAVTDENDKPVAGAVFAAYADPDGDGKIADDAKPASECTTDGEGACVMRVPAGSYVLVQVAAPAGLDGIDPVPFTFASSGQVASVTVVNYPPELPGAPAPAPAPHIGYSPVVDTPPTETVTDYAEAPVISDADGDSVPLPQAIGGTVVRVIRAPGDALRLLARDPKQAVAWIASLALFCLAVIAVRRRQQALALIVD